MRKTISKEERKEELNKKEQEPAKQLFTYYAKLLMNKISQDTKTTDLKTNLMYFLDNSNKYNEQNFLFNSIVFHIDSICKIEEFHSFQTFQGKTEKESMKIMVAKMIKQMLRDTPKIKLDKTDTLETVPIEVLGDILTKITLRNWASAVIKDMETDPKEFEEIINLDSAKLKKLKQIIFCNSKVANKITKLPTGKKGSVKIDKAKNTETFFQILTTNKSIKIDGNLNYFDRFVHDTICTFLEQEQTVITPTMILKAMRGNPKQTNYSQEQIQAVLESINKMRYLSVKINATNEGNLKKWNDKVIFENYLLPIKSVTVETGGNRIDGFKLLDIPPVWQYTKKTGQVATIQDTLIKKLKFDKHGLTYYLIYRLNLLKHDKVNKIKSNSNIIVIKKLFEELNLLEEYENKSKRKRIIDKIIEIYEIWKNEGEIKGYEVIKEGNLKAKIKIKI